MIFFKAGILKETASKETGFLFLKNTLISFINR